MVTVIDLHKSFLRAEEEIKFAELIIFSLESSEDDNCVRPHDSQGAVIEPRGVVIPALNELRYAAKHLSCAMQPDAIDQEEQLRRAERHCVRARLDALKAVVLFLARDFHQFSDDYRLSNIPAEDREQLNAYRQKIWEVLSDLSRDHSQSTDEDCEKMKAVINELHAIYIDTSKRRGVYNQLLEKIDKHDDKADKHDSQSTTQWIVGIVIAVVLAFIAGKL